MIHCNQFPPLRNKKGTRAEICPSIVSGMVTGDTLVSYLRLKRSTKSNLVSHKIDRFLRNRKQNLSKILREKLHFGKREGRILANVFPSPLSHSYITGRAPILSTRRLCKTRASHICGGLECRLGQKPFV